MNKVSNNIAILEEHFSKTVPAVTDSLFEFKAKIMSLPFAEDIKKNIYLAFEEAFINITFYAYPEKTDNVQITIDATQNQCKITLIDNGIPFDPTKNITTPKNFNLFGQVGGAGRMIINEIMDEINYSYDNKNTLTMIKYI